MPNIEAVDLTERRKADTELDIARVAAALFSKHGSAATTVEEIAAGAGIGVRTFYRYFRTKQEAVAPLLAFGAQRWRQLLADVPHEVPLPDALEKAAHQAMIDCDTTTVTSFGWTHGLLNATDNDPALRAVWVMVNDDSERQLCALLAERMDTDRNCLRTRLIAAAATAAIRVATETWAQALEPAIESAESPASLTVTAIRTLTASLRTTHED